MACIQRVSLRIYFFESRLLLAILYSSTNHTNIAAFLLMSLKLGFPSDAASSEQTEGAHRRAFVFKKKNILLICAS